MNRENQFNKTLKELSSVDYRFSSFMKMFLPATELWRITEDILYYFTEKMYQYKWDKHGNFPLDCGHMHNAKCNERCCVKCTLYETYDIYWSIDYEEDTPESERIIQFEGSPDFFEDEDWDNIYFVLNALSKGIKFTSVVGTCSKRQGLINSEIWSPPSITELTFLHFPGWR